MVSDWARKTQYVASGQQQQQQTATPFAFETSNLFVLFRLAEHLLFVEYLEYAFL
jgi:hypothetical protein